ncbi:hypothetical protein D3C71_1746140 [compost metagenome]
MQNAYACRSTVLDPANIGMIAAVFLIKRIVVFHIKCINIPNLHLFYLHCILEICGQLGVRTTRGVRDLYGVLLSPRPFIHKERADRPGNPVRNIEAFDPGIILPGFDSFLQNVRIFGYPRCVHDSDCAVRHSSDKMIAFRQALRDGESTCD